MFQYDDELADEYYLQHYTNTNNTVYICTPHVPMRTGSRRKYTKLHPNKYYWLRCDIHHLGFMNYWHERVQLSFIFSADLSVRVRFRLVVLAVISLTGIFGEYC